MAQPGTTVIDDRADGGPQARNVARDHRTTPVRETPDLVVARRPLGNAPLADGTPSRRAADRQMSVERTASMLGRRTAR